MCSNCGFVLTCVRRIRLISIYTLVSRIKNPWYTYRARRRLPFREKTITFPRLFCVEHYNVTSTQPQISPQRGKPAQSEESYPEIKTLFLTFPQAQALGTTTPHLGYTTGSIRVPNLQIYLLHFYGG